LFPILERLYGNKENRGNPSKEGAGQARGSSAVQHECVTEQRGMPVVFKITSKLIKLGKMQERY
jgi:hypothetical protein